MNIKCISINCHGLRDSSKCRNIFHWLRNLKPDVVFLQESHLLKRDKAVLQKEWEGLVFISPGESHTAGVIMVFSKRLNVNLIMSSNVYAPNQVSLRKQFFENFTDVLKGGIPTVLGGDFNSIEDINLDKNGGDKDLAVSALNGNFNLKDVFRHLNPSSRVFTWNIADGSVSCRLYKFYVSGDIFRTSSDCSITFFPYSDHEAVNLSF